MPFTFVKLTFNLNDDQCKNLREFYKRCEVLRLMDTKVCQLEYMDSWKKSEETKLAHYSKLGVTDISDRV